MTLNKLIEQLTTLKQQLELKGKTEVYIAEHGFSLGAIQVYLRDLHETDINFEPDVQNLDFVFPEQHLTKGVVIGVIPQLYERQKEDSETKD